MLAIYGTGGFGREVLPLVRSMAGGERIVFIDDAAGEHAPRDINGHDVLTLDQVPKDCRGVTIAVGDQFVRERIDARCADRGLPIMQVRAPDAEIYDAVEIGEGAILCARTLITSNVKIGRHFHCNIFSYVAHDCVIGDFVTFAPRVNCNGAVVIEDFAYIGAGALLRQGRSADQPLRIGRGAVVGMGAVITRDVPAGVTVAGNPARPLMKAG
jgi:sugar O-acyltransferase (sialic acid O-acetyltransferase NeuD family)